MIGSLYNPASWKDLTAGLAELRSGGGARLLAIADAFLELDRDATTIVRCADDERLTDRAAAADLAARTLAAAPFTDPGTPVVAALGTCDLWPAPPTSSRHVPHADGLPTVLVVSTTGDPATPYSAGVALAEALHARLLTVEGTQHGAVGQGWACVDDIAADYLVDLTLPAEGTRCAVTKENRRHDRDRADRPHEALRRDGRRRRPHRHRPVRGRDGLPRPERIGQVHHHADGPRPRHADGRGPPPSAAGATPQLPDPMRDGRRAAGRGWVHPNRSARTHLRWLAAAAGVTTGRVDEMLDLVGLTQVAGKRVGGFSLGMRQRLGLAAALLGDPEVLVLDEPANGLDPAGIVWMRGLLQRLAAEGRTVLVSSHLLAEMALTATELVVIGAGRLVAQGSTAEVLGGDGPRGAGAGRGARGARRGVAGRGPAGPRSCPGSRRWRCPVPRRARWDGSRHSAGSRCAS